MEEDIKILEDYILHFEKIGGEEIIKSDEIIKTIEYKEIKAIENLLQENKASKEAINTLTNKLEKVVDENKKLKKSRIRQLERYTEYHNTQIENFNNMLDDYIPISVIQNKIDELIENANNAKISLFKYDKSDVLYFAKDVLQEILEERNK